MTSFNDLANKAQKAINAALEPEEQVVMAIPGEWGSAIVATDRRVFVFKKGVTSGAFFGKQLNSWDYANVSGVEVKRGMTTHAIVVEVPGVEPVTKFGRMDKGPHSVWEAPNAVMTQKNDVETVAELRRLIADHQAHRSTTTADGTDPVAQVKQWAALRDEGLLTEEEFQGKKRQLLGL
jgi:hypothetical protein